MPKIGLNIYHRKDGRWEGRYHIKGTNKYKSVYAKSAAEVKEKLEVLKHQYKADEPSRQCNYLFSDIMLMWLESKKNKIKESSLSMYRCKLEKHIIPFFEGVRYSKFDNEQLDRFIHDKTEKGLSPKYINDMLIMIKSAARWAEKTHQYDNKIKNVELLKTERKEALALFSDEQKQLVKTINENKSLTAIGIYLSLFTGIRIGELCALQWKDIDFQRRVLHISKTVQRIKVNDGKTKTEVRITSPKTTSSTREIPLPKFIIDILMPFKTDDECYILSGTKKLVEPRCFSNRYKKVLKKADLPSYKFHSLRHTFAMKCLQCNFDMKTLSELLGHSSANITMKIYAHTSMEHKAVCMERLSEAA